MTSRRTFLRGAGILGGASLALGPARTLAALWAPADPTGFGVLTDLSVCVGCRGCEQACNQANKLPALVEPSEADVAPGVTRRPGLSSFTAVSTYRDPTQKDGQVFVKRQCMHCNEPACASACPVGALRKTEEGAVIYDETICMGCRYCMVACPFQIPSYEYESALEPRVRKCVLCIDRIRKQGGIPACVENCPTQASTFGKREDLLRLARQRIVESKGAYVDHIFGEHEAGGSSWLYISKVPFGALGFPTALVMKPYVELTKGALRAVPLVLVLGPALLMGAHAITNRPPEPDPADPSLPLATK
jgi:Fe-S-cluster-containing dehydrogenase component